MPGADTTTPVGDRMPGVNPAEAAAAASRTGLPAGRAATGETASRSPKTGLPASTKTAMIATATTAATQRLPRYLRRLGLGGSAVTSGAGPDTTARPTSDPDGSPAAKPEGQNAHRPSTPSIAGTRIRAAMRPTSTVIARPGP